MSKNRPTADRPQAPKKRSGPLARLASLRRARNDEVSAPSRQVAREQIRSRPGFYASLSADARAAVESENAPALLGPPPGDV